MTSLRGEAPAPAWIRRVAVAEMLIVSLPLWCLAFMYVPLGLVSLVMLVPNGYVDHPPEASALAGSALALGGVFGLYASWVYLLRLAQGLQGALRPRKWQAAGIVCGIVAAVVLMCGFVPDLLLMLWASLAALFGVFHLAYAYTEGAPCVSA